MDSRNLEVLRRAAEAMRPLDMAVVYVGGATVALYLDPYAASQARATADVDCVVPVAKLSDYQALESNLRRLGFRNSQEPGAPLCRWTFDDLIIDIMPIDESVLGFASRFNRLGFHKAMRLELSPSLEIRTLTLRYLFASKIEAYAGRGSAAPYESKDLEDLIVLLDGAHELVVELASEQDEVQTYASAWAAQFSADPRCRDLIEGHLPRGPLFDERVNRVVQKLKEMASWPRNP